MKCLLAKGSWPKKYLIFFIVYWLFCVAQEGGHIPAIRLAVNKYLGFFIVYYLEKSG